MSKRKIGKLGDQIINDPGTAEKYQNEAKPGTYTVLPSS